MGFTFFFFTFVNISYAKTCDLYESKGYEKVDYYVSSSDNKNYAFVGSNSGKYLLVKDAIEGEYYDDISFFYDEIRDKNNFYYKAKRDNKWMVVNNGNESLSYDKINYIRENSNNSRMSFYAENDGKGLIVIEGKELIGYDDIVSFEYSPVGNKYTYITKKDGKQEIFINGKQNKKYSFVESFIYSPNGKDIIFKAKKNGKWILVLGKKETEEFDSIGEYKYLLDGKSFVYIAEINSEFKLIKDGKKFGDYSIIDDFDYYDVDFEFKAKKNGKWFLVRNGVESVYKEIEEIENITTNTGGYTSQIKENGKSLLYKEGNLVNDYQYIDNLTYFGDRAVFEGYRDGKWYMVREDCSYNPLKLKYEKQKNNSKEKIEKTNNGYNLIFQLDTIVSRYSINNLKRLLIQINSIKGSNSYMRYKDICDYLESITLLRLFDLGEI